MCLKKSKSTASDRIKAVTVSKHGFTVKACSMRAVLRSARNCKDEVFLCTISRVQGDSSTEQSQEHPRSAKLKQEFSDIIVTALPKQLPKLREFLPEVVPLEPGAQPHYRNCRRLTPQEKEVLQEYIKQALEAGVIRESDSPWASQVVFVKKPDNSIRVCIDYRHLNKLTKKNRYGIPRPEELMDQIGGCKVFSSIDLKSGYYQVRLQDHEMERTAFSTPWGLYEYLVMPFGLCNAPSVFQKAINHTLRPLIGKFAVVYLDDILIYSRTEEEHEQHLRAVLELLRKDGWYCNGGKLQWFLKEIRFLGHIITEDGVKADPAKLEPIKNWPFPENVQEVRQFLGTTNYFRKFVEKYAQIAAPLVELTKKNLPESLWKTPERLEAFQKLKDALVSPQVLAVPDFTKPWEVWTDASGFCCGGILLQEGRPVAFHSKMMDETQKRYPTHDRELLAVFQAYSVWRCYLEGTPSVCYTDHCPLRFVQEQPNLNSRQVRWLAYLEGFRPYIEYRPGATNPADGLSRMPQTLPKVGEVQTVTQGAEKSAVGTALEDSQWGHRRAEVNSSLASVRRLSAFCLKPTVGESDPVTCPHVGNEASATAALRAAGAKRKTKGSSGTANGPLAGTSQNEFFPTHVEWFRMHYLDDSFCSDPTWVAKEKLIKDASGLLYKEVKGKRLIVVGAGAVNEVLHWCHGAHWAGHPGVTKTLQVVRQKFWWPSWRQDTLEHVKKCFQCATQKNSNQKTPGLLKPLAVPDRPWQSMSLDFVTGLPEVAGKDAVLVTVDRFSKMARLLPCNTTVTAAKAVELLQQSVFSLFGHPEEFIGDRDTRWTSEFLQEYKQLQNCKFKMSTAFHPQTDGQTERTNQTMEQLLRLYCSSDQQSWLQVLPMVEFVYNSTPHVALSREAPTCPFQVVYGWKPSTPFDKFLDYRPKGPVGKFSKWVTERENQLKLIKQSLQKVQQLQKTAADKKRTAVSYKEGDYVLLSSKNLRLPGCRKLQPRFLGPLKVLQVLPSGNACKLELPEQWKVHHTFNVSLLRKWEGPLPEHPPVVMVEGAAELLVESILTHKTVKHRGGSTTKYLVKWAGLPPAFNEWLLEADLTSDGKYRNSVLDHYRLQLDKAHKKRSAGPLQSSRKRAKQ